LACHAELGDVACVAPLILEPEGSISASRLAAFDAPLDKTAEPSSASYVTAVDGRCALVSGKALADHGLRDVFAGVHCRVADFALRAHRAGWRNVLEPGAQFLVTGNATHDDALDHALLTDAFGSTPRRSQATGLLDSLPAGMGTR
jgi:GT2 family glycosyltransferase